MSWYSPGGGGSPFSTSVRDGDTGGWTTTALGPDGVTPITGYKGCPPNFWDDAPATPPDDGKKKKDNKGGDWREYVFVFEHTNGEVVVWCDTNRNGKFVGQTGIHGNTIDKCCKETLLPGGNSTAAPFGLALGHVSCSGNWASGWSTTDHPDPVNDPEWRVVFYRLDKRFAADEQLGVDFVPCEHNSFPPVSATAPVIEPIIRLYS